MHAQSNGNPGRDSCTTCTLARKPETGVAISTKSAFDKGQLSLDIGENRRLLGQYPPEAKADLSIANTDGEATLLTWLHEMFNKRMLGEIDRRYAANG